MKKPGDGSRAFLWVRSTGDQSFSQSLRQFSNGRLFEDLFSHDPGRDE